MKRVVTVQDISCVGKCSLTVALPIISAMGVETSVIPTAVLSTHTAFRGFTFKDLTDQIKPIEEHWKTQSFIFDGMYSGYLGSKEQIDLVKDLFMTFKTKDNFIVVDPAMADNGNLYPGFDMNFVKEMKSLCAVADIIVPNLTEACLMFDEKFPGDNYDEEFIKKLLVKMAETNHKKVVLTGISFDSSKLGVYAYDYETKSFFNYYDEQLPVRFHGTGDIYASSLVGALANNKSFEESLEIATDYTVECIKETMKDPNAVWYGVNFETAIPYLLKQLGK